MSAARELLQQRRDSLAQDLSRANSRLAVAQAEVVRGQVEAQALTEQIAEYDVAIKALTPGIVEPAPEVTPEPEPEPSADDENPPAEAGPVDEEPAGDPDVVDEDPTEADPEVIE